MTRFRQMTPTESAPDRRSRPFTRSRAVRGLSMAAAAAALALMGPAVMTPAANAASWPIVDVQAGAAARYDPWVDSYSFAGYVTPDAHAWWTSNTQQSYVWCYADSGWATGNYSSNRWFKVYVYTTRNVTSWFFVHSSYVYNQKPVPAC
jgi:hypothetical protein